MFDESLHKIVDGVNYGVDIEKLCQKLEAECKDLPKKEGRKRMTSKISPDDRATLQKAKAFYGKFWRKDIAHAWFSGDYRGIDSNIASALQQIRNSERDWNIDTVRIGQKR
jgi:hypothetical protein